MTKNSRTIQFGENVEGYEIPVLNEREIRAAAGILFVFMFISVLTAMMEGSFVMLKYTIIFFLTDMLIRVLINPRFSPTLIIGRLIVRNQVPEYVGAPQKKFAWVIGIIIASLMVVFQILINSYGPITGIMCLICLIFLFFETSFGICLGCKVYPWFFKEKVQHCPGEVCDIRQRADIQKTSVVQVLILVGFIAYIVIAVILLQPEFVKKPHALFGPEESSQAR